MNSPLPLAVQWTPLGRTLVFLLAGTSIWCLLSEMYGLCGMRTFFWAILLPSTLALYGISLLDHFRGEGSFFRAVIIGTLAGLAGAIAYDVFRLPFVFSDAWGLGRLGIPQMPLFKVFPRFGAMILGQPLEQASYSLSAHLVGWTYHFSNGATFGVMFAAAYLGRPTSLRVPQLSMRKTILWATLMAVGIEICLLVSPYTGFFNIHMTPRFVAVTLLAHIVFGVGLGAYFAWHALRLWPRSPVTALAAQQSRAH